MSPPYISTDIHTSMHIESAMMIHFTCLMHTFWCVLGDICHFLAVQPTPTTQYNLTAYFAEYMIMLRLPCGHFPAAHVRRSTSAYRHHFELLLEAVQALRYTPQPETGNGRPQRASRPRKTAVRRSRFDSVPTAKPGRTTSFKRLPWLSDRDRASPRRRRHDKRTANCE